MTQSMTAFARVAAEQDTASIVWEMRSLNHRYLDIHLKLPESLRVFEADIRDTIAQQLKRGKVDVVVKLQTNNKASDQLRLNKALLQNVYNLVQQTEQAIGVSTAVDPLALLSWPNVVVASEQDMDCLRDLVLASLNDVLQEMCQQRQTEGGKLAAILQQQADKVRDMAEKVRELYPASITDYRQKLLARLEEFDTDYDPNRLEQELIMIKQKSDITEELDRLGIHLQHLEKALQQTTPSGRRLDFLMQELNREVNTIAAKSHSPDISQLTVELKVVIDQMREQIQNIQ